MRSKRQQGGNFGTTLQEFKGRLVKYSTQEKQNNFNQKKIDTEVTLEFSEVEVIRSKEAYGASTAELPIKYSDYLGSQWVSLEDSILTITGEELLTDEIGPIDLVVGSVLHMDQIPHQYEDKEGTQKETMWWVAKGIEGYSSDTPAERAEKLYTAAAGDMAVFKATAMQDAVVREDSNLLAAIMSGSYKS